MCSTAAVRSAGTAADNRVPWQLSPCGIVLNAASELRLTIGIYGSSHDVLDDARCAAPVLLLATGTHASFLDVVIGVLHAAPEQRRTTGSRQPRGAPAREPGRCPGGRRAR